jgi:hypothetical protein
MGMRVVKEELIILGKPIWMDIIHIADKEIIVFGKSIRIAQLKEEWDADVDDPETIIRELKHHKVKADLFTFMQRLPYSKPRFNYSMEWDNVAAIPISNYDIWFKKQLHGNPRKKIRKSQRLSVIVKVSNLDDDFINGINDIYNETPIRQGRPYWNYGMNYELTKKENSQFIDRATFIGAYYKDELIGYIRIVYTDRFARTMGILAKNAHRDKAPMNLLIAKAVEVCADKKVPHLVYAKFNYGKIGSDTLQDFKYYNGFEGIALPRYYIPLTTKGKIILSLNLHHGIVGIIPKRLVRILRNMKHQWHARNNTTASQDL